MDKLRAVKWYEWVAVGVTLVVALIHGYNVASEFLGFNPFSRGHFPWKIIITMTTFFFLFTIIGGLSVVGTWMYLRANPVGWMLLFSAALLLFVIELDFAVFYKRYFRFWGPAIHFLGSFLLLASLVIFILKNTRLKFSVKRKQVLTALLIAAPLMLIEIYKIYAVLTLPARSA